MVNKPNVCVVGAGHWGKNLIRNFDQLAALYAVCDSSPALRERAAAQHPRARSFETLEAALDDPAVEAVVIATPAEQHYAMGRAALERGKDVFIEKPLCLDAEDAARLVNMAHERGRILMVGHLLRYHPAVRKMQELVSGGELGKIEYIYSNRLSMGKIRREENALWSFAPHDISVILALLGQMPVQVTATGGAYLQPNIADVTVSNLLFDQGVRAHIFVSWLHPYKEQRLVVLGSKQMAVFEDTRPDNKLMLFNKSIEWKDGGIEAAKPEGAAIAFDSTEPLREECAHFLRCIATRSQPVTPGEEGTQVLRVLQACQRSLQMNGEPVQVGAASSHKVLAL